MSKESISKNYTPETAITVGYVNVFEPSTKFDKDGVYQLNALISAKEGKKIRKICEETLDSQYEKFRKNSKKMDITACVPYVEVEKDDKGCIIKETPDPEGRYILKTKNKAYIRDGEIGQRIPVFDSKLKPVKNLKFGAGSKVKLGISIEGYSSNLGTGVTIKLKAVQILEVQGFNTHKAEDFFTEEEGFEYTEEDVENQAENDEEADF